VQQVRQQLPARAGEEVSPDWIAIIGDDPKGTRSEELLELVQGKFRPFGGKCESSQWASPTVGYRFLMHAATASPKFPAGRADGCEIQRFASRPI
jgi:hypothetical protein